MEREAARRAGFVQYPQISGLKPRRWAKVLRESAFSRHDRCKTTFVHRVASRRCYGIGTRLVDVLKGVQRCIRQGRFGSGNSAQLHHTFFIGDRGHRINHFL